MDIIVNFNIILKFVKRKSVEIECVISGIQKLVDLGLIVNFLRGKSASISILKSKMIHLKIKVRKLKI